MQTANFPAPPRSESSRSNERSAQRKPAPSPLQVSQISSPITEKFVQASPKELSSPGSSRGGSGNSYSPRSQHDSPAFGQSSSRSPNEWTPRPTADSRQGSKETVPASSALKQSPLATPKADPQRQVRNVSAPLSSDSPPHLPSEIPNVRNKSSLARAEARFIPRTSSLDSTMSSTSSTTTMSHSVTPDPLSPRAEDIAQLITSAGSAEAAISQLLKDKKQAAAQNAQLFRLVQKQRSVMGGMKTDLDQALQERDALRKRVKEKPSETASSAPMASSAVKNLRQASRGDSVSSVLTEDELPIQRHSVAEEKSSVYLEGMASSREAPKAEKELAERPSASVLRTVGVSSRSSSPVHGSPASIINLDNLQVEESDSRRTTIQSPMTPIAPLEIHKRSSPTESNAPNKIKDAVESAASPASFAARRSFTGTRKTSNSSPLIGSSSPTEETMNTSPITRKGPPAPLKLQRLPETAAPTVPLPKSPEEYGPEDHTDSEYGDVGEVDELPTLERGRKKTREEDDREREMILLQEQASRSRSMKQKSKSKSVPKAAPPAIEQPQRPPQSTSLAAASSPSIRGFAPISPANSRQDHLSPHASLAGILSGPPSSSGSIVERTVTLSPPLVSPGLPVSPRPADRHPYAAMPRSPRDGLPNSPPFMSPNSNSAQQLSPRPPRQPIPMPPHTPSSLSSPYSARSGEVQPGPAPRSPALQPANSAPAPTSPRLESVASAPRSPALQPPASHSEATNDAKEPLAAMKVDTSAGKHSPSSSDIATSGVYVGLVSEAYPDLLLPPNAIPSIMIKVTSSRLKPSRHSTISPKGTDEEPVFTLGISARSDRRQLWRVEKPIMSLPYLDHQLKQACAFDVRLPEKSLFSGQSPAKIDARREALEKYFETILDTPMNEQAALTICQFLSTQTIPAEDHEGMKTAGVAEDKSPVTVGPDGKVIKEGYLTKRGKQFGGWKARFFVLDEPILRYYDAPGGSLQGTIKLSNAQIGRQSAHAHHSPTRSEDQDNQFRHAFLILEPKKKDSNSHMKHVLCAESDEERDEWVFALLQYVGLPAPEHKSRPGATRNASDSKGATTAGHKKGEHEEDASPPLEHDGTFNALQGTSYEQTSYAEPPTRMAPQAPTAVSPTKASFQPNHHHHAGPVTISRPSNGAVIQDASMWGNKAPASPKSKEKEQRKRSIWGFRDKLADVGASHTNGSNHSMGNFANQTATRNVFGTPLREAVEYCTARGSNVPLPSVVYRCIEYLEAKGASSEEGIFRLSGSNLLIKQLKEKFNNEGDFDFLAEDTYYDVHAVASLLKLYLRELPSMVLTRDLHMEFLQYMELEDKAQKIAGYNQLVHRLPLENWTLVRALSQFLIGIVNNSHINKMSVRNVGIVFAPTLNMPAPVFASFLTDFDAIFVADPNVEQPIEPAPASPLTPEDIRSPRRQIFSDIPTPSYQQDNFPQHVKQAPQPQQSHQVRHYDDPSRSRIEGQGQVTGGFIPMQPSYETSYLGAPTRNNHRQSVLIPGPEMSGTQRAQHSGQGSSGSLGRDAKSRRRESSMMFMGGGGAGAKRKSSMPSMGPSVTEE